MPRRTFASGAPWEPIVALVEIEADAVVAE